MKATLAALLIAFGCVAVSPVFAEEGAKPEVRMYATSWCPYCAKARAYFAALKAGAIDVYPEYTGTIAKEILKLSGDPGTVALNRALASQGLAVGTPLGFSNGYGLAMREERAEKLGVRTLSDLARQPRL